MRPDLAARYTIGEPSYETEFVVYPAEDKRLQRQVFIVVPDISLKSDKARMERVWASVNEAKALPSLRFVEIVDLVPATADDPDFYIVERRLDKTLRAFLDEQEAIAFESAASIVRQVLEGLATLHGAGYAHNALTDTCLYVSDDYSGLAAKVGNLHLIAPIGERIVPPYAPEFGPPEIYASGTFTASASVDVYALGMIAYKLFLPRRTYTDIFQTALIWDDEHNREQSWKNIHLDPTMVFPRLDTLNPGFPEKVAAVVDRMLSRDPATRPRDGVEALEEFSRATVGTRGYTMPPAGALPSRNDAAPPKPKFWTPVKIGLTAVFVAIWIGVGVVTVPMLLGPDPELVKQVDIWRKAAETRRQSAIAVKAPERPTTDDAGKAYADGVGAFDAGVAAVTAEEYEKALVGFQHASDAFDITLVDIARDAATDAEKQAAEVGGSAAPAFKEASVAMKKAADEIAARKPGAAVKSFNTAATGFTNLSTALQAVSDARRQAGERRKAAVAMGAEDEAGFADAEKSLKAGEDTATAFALDPAVKNFGTAASAYGALIDAIMASKGEAETLRAKAINLSSNLSQRVGPNDATLAALLDRLTAAETIFTAQAYKRAAVAYGPLIDELQAMSGRGFCPAATAATFTRIDEGRYKADKIRLMTGSLDELGGMLGLANGEIALDKPFCLQAAPVTRGEMVAFFTATGDEESAALYRTTPEAQADDVPQPLAQDYARWYSQQNGGLFRLPTAKEWIVGATQATAPPPGDGVSLQWSSTPCENGGHLAFLAQDSMSFAVCSDDGAGGYLRLVADVK